MENESDIARIARLSGLKPEQVRYDLRGYCRLKGNQLSITISDNEALKIISEKRNKLVWFLFKNITPEYESRIIYILDSKIGLQLGVYPFSEKEWVNAFSKWAYITPDMLPILS